ncbi:MAG: SUF system NifU family Fe-S cluster assembly protein [Saccharofermentans sp.]|nr:SUF system NifU family Fe-S cluster assembly protein [Saccharofermentans sp.]
MDLKSLYSQIITENSRAVHNRRPVHGATISLEGNNPSCGDDIVLQIKIENGVIEDLGFIGTGCAISQASASLMIDLIKGKKVEEAKELADLYLRMIKGEADEKEYIDKLEDCSALAGVSKVPARVKCAVLAWHTLEDALDQHPV